mgnify:CR=1 FL=1
MVASQGLDENSMVVDFKALKLAVGGYIERLDHAMAISSEDPLLPALRETYPEALVVFEGVDPTTEILAKDLFDYINGILERGFVGSSSSGAEYRIPAGRVWLERVRIWETPSSWAEYGVG